MRASVRLHEDHEELVLAPARGTDPRALRADLRALGLEPGRPRPEGVVVDADHVSALLDLPNDVAAGLSWAPIARRFAENRVLAEQRHPKLLADVRWARSAGRAEALSRVGDLPGAEGLDDHQLVNVAVLTSSDCYGLCLFDEQGTGKTVTAIFAWDLLAHRDEIDRVLVVAPKSMTAEWVRDLERFRPGLYSVTILDGTRRAKRRQLRGGADVVVAGFETAVSLEDSLKAVVGGHRTLLVVDESFHVKNPETRRSGTMKRVRELCERAWVLCGTPAPNAPRDLKAQFDLADFGVAFSAMDLPDDREEAVPVVRAVLRRRGAYLRSLKRHVLSDLPAKRFNVVRVPLAPRQREVYDSLRGQLVEDLRGVDQAEFDRRRASYMARRTALLQTCSNPRALLQDYEEEPAKLDALRELVADLSNRGEKIVVWSFFRASLEAVEEALSGFGTVRYDGSVTELAQRREAVRRFQEDPGTMVFVGNPAAAGAGLTLTAARYAVYESFSGQAAHYLQSLDRIHRRGQAHQVELIVLLCEGTLEESEYERLRAKEAAAQDLLGDSVEAPFTRDSLLSELLEGGVAASSPA